MSTTVSDLLREYEQGPRAKQKAYLQKYDFEKKPIDYPSEIQEGDHLICKGSSGERSYFHHMLCTGTSDGQVTIIEYTGPYSGFSAVLSVVACKDLGSLGKIVEQTYAVQEFLKKKILKVIWPDELRRFSVKKVIERARTRIDETRYDFLKNNCEHFITWSICGLKVSLQVKNWFLWAQDIVCSVLVGLYDIGKRKIKEKAGPLLIKGAANVSDEVVGVLLGIVLEAVMARYEIRKASTDHSKTEREYRAKKVEIVAKASGRVAGGNFGSWLGPLMCPAGGLLSSLIGGAIVAGLGHVIGAVIAWVYENYASIGNID